METSQPNQRPREEKPRAERPAGIFALQGSRVRRTSAPEKRVAPHLHALRMVCVFHHRSALIRAAIH